jgi:molecular chaperone DnaJ
MCEVPISFVQAALGDVISIPGLGGEAPHEIQIPQGTQPNDMLKVPGKGMPSLSGHENRGDMYVKLVVKIPKKLSKRQTELLQVFAADEGHAPSKKKKGKNFWSKMTK